MTNLPRTFRQKSASSRPKLRVGLVSKEVPRCPASFRLPPRNADFAPLSATKWREMRGDRMLETRSLRLSVCGIDWLLKPRCPSLCSPASSKTRSRKNNAPAARAESRRGILCEGLGSQAAEPPIPRPENLGDTSRAPWRKLAKSRNPAGGIPAGLAWQYLGGSLPNFANGDSGDRGGFAVHLAINHLVAPRSQEVQGGTRILRDGRAL